MLVVSPIVDRGQYDRVTDPKDRIIENLRADVRIKDRKIESLQKSVEVYIQMVKEARKSKLLSELNRLDENAVSELELIMTKYEVRA